MSHEVETMAYAGELPWHGLGVPVEDGLTDEEMLEAAGLDWSVEKRKLSYVFDGARVPTDRYALVRDDGTCLSTVGKGWNPMQNREALSFFREFVDEGSMSMHTAGSLNNGRDVWALGKLNIEREIISGDALEGYILFHNPHVFGKSWSIQHTSVRVVCNNTLTAAMSRESSMRFAKSHAVKPDVSQAVAFARDAIAQLDDYVKHAQALSRKKMTNEDFVEFVYKIFPGGSRKAPTPTQMKVLESLEDQPGVEFGEGTWWQGFNAITYTTDHVLGKSSEQRMNSAWFGLNRTRKEKALALALAA